MGDRCEAGPTGLLGGPAPLPYPRASSPAAERGTPPGSRGHGCAFTFVLVVGGFLGILLLLCVGLVPLLISDGPLFGSDEPAAVDPPPAASLRDPTCDDVYYEQDAGGAAPYWRPFPSVGEIQAALDTPREHRGTATLLTCRLEGVRSDGVLAVVVATWVEDSAGRQRVIYRETIAHGAVAVAAIPVSWHRR